MIMTFFSIGNFSEIRSFESYVFPFYPSRFPAVGRLLRIKIRIDEIA